jgi:hypothetical protein
MRHPYREQAGGWKILYKIESNWHGLVENLFRS